MLDLDRLLRFAVEERASDVHLKVGARPHVRVDGALRESAQEVLAPDDTEQLAGRILPSDQAAGLRYGREADGVYSIQGVGRFRVSAFGQQGQVAFVLRRIVPGVPGIDALGLPPVATTLADAPSGLVLVSGLAGSGRTSTLAAMVDHVNSSRSAHIVTIEQPIEVVHTDKRAVIDQREVGRDTETFAIALGAVAHQDPDVVVVGALPDADTAMSALEVAGAGRLVLAVSQAVGAPDAVTRLIDRFPPAQRAPVRSLLARTLQGVLCQRLLPRAGGRGRVPAVEVLVANGPVSEALADSESPEKIQALVAEGEMWGMQTFDQSLAALYRRGLVTRENALAHATYEPAVSVMLDEADRTRAAMAAARPEMPVTEPTSEMATPLA
ncbi:MAG: PilT/PilU family type 4a pilus ATPase [Actinobacteria bacterium]|nr:PilT/PilU family type 4a pilus ATPase [Actinomycetota bacterium]